MASRGKWCLFCDKWIKNDLLDRSISSRTDEEVEDYWKLHEKSLPHLTKKKARGEFPNVTWDGHTIYASFAAGQKILDYQEMSHTMRKHGYTTRVHSIDNDAYIVGFRDPIGAEKALTNQGGNIITRPIFKSAPKAANKPVPRLDASDPWEAQAKQLAVAFKLAVTPEVEEQHRKQQDHLLTDIVTTFQPLCRKVDCFVYGSRATGLADIDSDIDVHIKLDYADCDFEKPLSKESHEKLLRAAVKLLRRKPLVFSNTYFVLAARVPVLHFVHNPTMVECDVTFKNMLGVHNSQFLRFVGAQDERILLLLFVVKRWRKAHSLPMSNYCFTMLAILFLQTLAQPLLPPILQLKGDADRLVLEQGWVCGFSSKRIANHNRSSLKQLTVAFFGFVARLDFGVDVICPMTASTIEKWRFLRAETLPEEMQGLARFDKNEGLLVKKPVCVQDPFELNHNVAKNVGAKNSIELTTFCAKLAEFCELKTNLSIEDLLKFSPSCEGVKLQDNSFTKKIFLQNYFPADLELLKSKSIRELWFEDVVMVIYDLFKDVLDCSIQMDSPPRKVEKMAGKSERLAAWTLSTRTMLFSGR
ncbi:speckle targeted PIP5K1A-regulated poly(A) polymerase-like [Cloeon dipterum]|uniref:speckle targeted PIP5K1A-regulated poly(A) polymerase-like n=1 Tax=Cloeon dipterum TaxID=197152 RepID=UPI00321F6653